MNTAAVRGVVVQIITHLDGRTLRFFDQLDNSIDVRHSDELDSLGFVQDQSEVIQYLNIEDNPVGRGKEDAALIIESGRFHRRTFTSSTPSGRVLFRLLRPEPASRRTKSTTRFG